MVNNSASAIDKARSLWEQALGAHPQAKGIILISDEADDNYRTDGDTNDESDGRTPLEKMLKMEIAFRKLKKRASNRAPLSPPRSD